MRSNSKASKPPAKRYKQRVEVQPELNSDSDSESAAPSAKSKKMPHRTFGDDGHVEQNTCNWGSSFVPCYDVYEARAGGKYFVAEVWAGDPDALGLHELVQGPDGNLWLTHQERGEILRMRLDEDLFFKKVQVNAFKIGGTDALAALMKKTGKKERSNGVHGMIWTTKKGDKAPQAVVVTEYEQAVRVLTFSKDYEKIDNDVTYPVKAPKLPKGHQCNEDVVREIELGDHPEKAKKVKEAGLHTLVADKHGRVWFTMKWTGCVGVMRLDESDDEQEKAGDAKYFYIPRVNGKVPLSFYISYNDNHAAHGQVWFNSISTNQMGVIDSSPATLADLKDGNYKQLAPPKWAALDSVRGFGETDVRPGGFVVLDDGTCLFAAYNRFGTLGRITLSKKLGAGGAEYWVQDDVEYVAQLPEHAALLHLQVNDLTKCTAALGKAAEADVKGCDVYLVGSANDFGGEAEANSVKGRYKRHSQMDKIIWAKNVRLKKEASSDGIIGYYGEDETSMRDGLVHVRAPTQKSWIHRVTQIKKPGGKMFLAATELRNNRVLIISPPDVGPFHPEDAELRDVLISHAHSQSGEGLAVNGGINAQFQQLVRDFMKDMPTTTHKLVDHIFSPSKEDLVTTSDIDLSEDEDASPSTKLTEKIDPQQNVDVLVEKFRHKYRRRFPHILERFPGGHKTHTHEAPIIEPGERQQEPFVPIVGRAVYPRGWLSEASKMEVDQHVH